MAKATSRAARSKRTKDQLIDEMEEIERRHSNVESVDPTTATLVKESAAKAREAVKGLSIDNIVSKGATFGLEVQRTLAGLTEQAVQEAEKLKEIQEAILVESAELERLHDLDVVSASIRALIEEHTQRMDALNEEYTQTRSQLEKQEAVARIAWSEEIAANTKAVAQRNADTQAARQKEQAEYEYRTNQARQRAEEDFKYKLQIAERDAVEKAGAASKVLADRFNQLAAQEAEHEQARVRIAGIDAEIAAAVKAAEGKATGMTESRMEAKFALERKDFQTALALEQQKNAALVAQNTKLAQEGQQAAAQVDAAKRQVTEITIKALEASSGQMALQQVTAFAQGQGNGSSSRTPKA
jgi:hypothetical protein